MSRLSNLQEINSLNAERDCQRIVHLIIGLEFPWDTTRALEVALYRTYCVPTISALLHRTGEFYEHTQRRYDDTALIVAEMCKWGYDDGRGRDALDRMNWAHSHFKISNDDFLYVLSTFIFEPVKWIDRFCWRKTVLNERLGFYYFWRNVGMRMGIQNIPGSYEAFAQWAAEYERRTFSFAETNQKIGAATRDLFASWFPRLFTPFVRYGIYALLDDDMIASFGFPKPLPGTRAVLATSLRARGMLIRFFPARRKPNFVMDRHNRTHPNGYRIEELGPPKLVAAEKRRTRL